MILNIIFVCCEGLKYINCAGSRNKVLPLVFLFLAFQLKEDDEQFLLFVHG